MFLTIGVLTVGVPFAVAIGAMIVLGVFAYTQTKVEELSEVNE